MNSFPKAVRHRLEWLAVRCLACIIPRLPRSLCHIFASFCGTVAAFIHLPGRRVALSNLDAAFGFEMSARRKHALVRESYQHLSRVMADLFWSPRLSAENFAQIFDLTDLERLKRERAGDEGLIFACLHYGGFEWIGLALGLSGFNARS